MYDILIVLITTWNIVVLNWRPRYYVVIRHCQIIDFFMFLPSRWTVTSYPKTTAPVILLCGFSPSTSPVYKLQVTNLPQSKSSAITNPELFQNYCLQTSQIVPWWKSARYCITWEWLEINQFNKTRGHPCGLANSQPTPPLPIPSTISFRVPTSFPSISFQNMKTSTLEECRGVV